MKKWQRDGNSPEAKVVSMDDNKRRETNDEEDVILGSEQSEVMPESEDAGQARMAKDDQIEQELEQLKGIATQLDNNYKRALADYQNLQRRTQEEKAEWIKMAGKDVVLKLLPVLDTLMMAAKHLQDKGLDLSIGQFLKVLQDEGVIKIETIGKAFDPNTMEAVTTQEVDDKEKGKVIEEARAGFMYHDSVLRPAQVIVGK